jgi:hypothetical protein
MLPLVVSSVLMWALIINRVLFLRALNQNDIIRDEAKEYVLKNISPDITKYRGLRALFVFRFLERRCGESSVDKYILDETVMSMVSSFDKYLACIGILAAVSPLFGLLGTVIGYLYLWNRKRKGHGRGYFPGIDHYTDRFVSCNPRILYAQFSVRQGRELKTPDRVYRHLFEKIRVS